MAHRSVSSVANRPAVQGTTPAANDDDGIEMFVRAQPELPEKESKRAAEPRPAGVRQSAAGAIDADVVETVQSSQNPAAAIPGEMPFAEASGDVEPIPSAGEHFNAREWVNYVVDRDHTVPLDNLVWDKEAKLGQIRRYNSRKVVYHFAQMQSTGAPVTHIHVHCKDLASMFFSARNPLKNFLSHFSDGNFVLLGGQHIPAALPKYRNSLMQGGQPVPETFRSQGPGAQQHDPKSHRPSRPATISPFRGMPRTLPLLTFWRRLLRLPRRLPARREPTARG